MSRVETVQAARDGRGGGRGDAAEKFAGTGVFPGGGLLPLTVRSRPGVRPVSTQVGGPRAESDPGSRAGPAGGLRVTAASVPGGGQGILRPPRCPGALPGPQVLLAGLCPGQGQGGALPGAGSRVLPAAIRVSCTGACRVSGKANDSTWAAEESYANSSLSLADKGSLPAGEHSFPFQFLLPATVPTSFEGPFGRIVYQLRAAIDTPRFCKDRQCSLAFYVLSPLNLN
ncbi:PREDICTED: arrestin domain-containing protein 1, partial [Condylura cristata]|uniref:arrestin domain-containing protein 1 n=1 Tax=Condylura cristata TaxID=143302 RepID=UPI000642DD79